MTADHDRPAADPNKVDTIRLALMLTELPLPRIKQLWQDFAARADAEGWPAARFLAALAERRSDGAMGNWRLAHLDGDGVWDRVGGFAQEPPQFRSRDFGTGDLTNDRPVEPERLTRVAAAPGLLEGQ